MTVLRPADFFHTGIVVADLESAITELTAIGGYRWTTPMTNALPVRIGNEVQEVEFRMSYSVQAPHLELVQAIPGTLWTPAPGTAAHHLGYFVDDVAAASRQLEAAGFAFEAGTEVFAYHNNSLGVRVEIVQRGLFGDWPAFLEAASAGNPLMAIAPEQFRLDGRVAVVTGGGAGIGRGIAAGLAAFGASVAIWERDEQRCAATAQALTVLGVVADVRDELQVDTALAQTISALGTPSVLVNNAGGTFFSPLLETSENGWDALYRANLRHVLLCTQRVARAMVAARLPGSIVNITSIEGARAAPGYAAYAAAKAGVINYTQTAALELACHGIRVNALAPDITLTEGLAGLAGPQTESARFQQIVPLGRPGHVDDLAAAAVFLASDLAAYLTGQTLHVDGGTQAAGGWYHPPESGGYVYGPN